VDFYRPRTRFMHRSELIIFVCESVILDICNYVLINAVLPINIKMSALQPEFLI
jgi:hypothetical protein